MLRAFALPSDPSGHYAVIATERNGQQLLTLFELKKAERTTPAVKMALYNHTMLVFVTLTADKVRLWDALSGELLREQVFTFMPPNCVEFMIYGHTFLPTPHSPKQTTVAKTHRVLISLKIYPAKKPLLGN